MATVVKAETYEGDINFGEILPPIIQVIAPSVDRSLFDELKGAGKGNYSDESIFEIASAVCSVTQLTRREYKRIRKSIIQIFRAGDHPELKASDYFAEDTEYGDLNDTLEYVLSKKVPNPPLPYDHKLSLDERIEWRDFLIKELDEMVAR